MARPFRRSLLLAALWPCAALAQTTWQDWKVQTPQLAAPQRASLVGQLASVVFGPADVSRGAFTLPSPFEAPSERGPLLAEPFPTYSGDAGMTEWGAGWRAALSFTRSRLAGDLDWATDELTGPYGRMLKGTDGAWYPVGLSKLVRVDWTGDVITAYLPDGTKATYGGTAKVATPSGTYAWHLTDVVSVTGRKTHLDWEANASGRLFLARVSYGGVGDAFQDEIELQYETLAVPFEDYRSGQLQALDRRVKTVVVRTKHATTGVFEERWRYELGYFADGFGPGFYLATVQRTFRSGERPPPARYEYALAAAQLAAATVEPAPKVAQVLRDLGPNALQPTNSTIWDADEDGMSDLESAYDQRLVRQTETGFEYVTLPPRPSDVFDRCRPAPSSNNPPRLLSQVRAGAGDETTYVVDINPNTYKTTTYFTVCSREGRIVQSLALSNNWQPSSLNRFVDLNRDRKPDLLRFVNGGAYLLPNTSTATAFSFGAAIGVTLRDDRGYAFTPDTVWVHDFNGDGVADIIGRYSAGIYVWYGKGRFQFTTNGRKFSLFTASGTAPTIGDYGFTFVDANKDGLTDVVLTRKDGNGTFLYMNRGAYFQETPVEALRGVGTFWSRPVIADLLGSGNTEISYTSTDAGGAPVGWSIGLDAAGTGLMSSADDGKGTVLRFEWGRSAPEAGARERHALLARLTVESSGSDVVTYDYAYGGARMHSVGKFLVGYDQVGRSDLLGSQTASFLNEDRYAGVPLGSTTRDALVPGLERFEASAYEEAPFRGIARLRALWKRSGHRATDGTGVEVAHVTRNDAWWNELCPARVVKETASGTLTSDRTYASLAAFDGHLACVEDSAVETGAHPDPSLDFALRTQIGRNAVGLVTSLASLAPEGTWTLQTVSYGQDWQVDSVAVPGKGRTTVAYDAATGLLRSVTTPEGVVTEATGRDPATDALLKLRTTRGTLAHEESYAYDGLERLRDTWDDVGASTALNPDVRYAYRYATATTPAAVTTSVLIDAAAMAVSDVTELSTAWGAQVGTARHVPEGWALGPITWRARSQGETATWRRAASAADPATLDWTALFAGADDVERAVAGPFGVTADARVRLHADVERQSAESLAISGGMLVRSLLENGAFGTSSQVDADEKVRARTDEAGTTWSYAYDALGRLRQVRLPDGTTHTATYDGHGRPSRIVRQGVATIEYRYDPASGLLVEKRFLSRTGAARRSVTLAYDAAGRVVRQTHTDVASGATRVHRYWFDGSSPESPGATTTPGLLTAVSGDGWVKRFEYRSDGKPTRRTLEVGTWRKIVTDLTYDEAGQPRGQATSVWAGATRLARSERADAYDAFGRVASTSLQGAPFASYAYDADGQVSAVSFANGDAVSFTYDPLTRRRTGSAQGTTAFAAATSQRLNARGLVDAESIQIGGVLLQRRYAYSAQRFLAGSTDAARSYEYGFDGTGLLSRVVNGGVATSVVRSADAIVAGATTWALDDSGRVVQRGDLTLTYGPDGQVAEARRGGSTWTFLYDENGKRLAKLVGGVPVAAYPDEGWLDASQLLEPVRIGSRAVGVLRNGAFETVATDLRGTVIAEPDGAARVASPFGVRDVRPAVAAALDYVEKGFDADLGLVRMGVRDYDPAIAQFTTPDPLFLEEPGQSLRSPAEASLYAYAGANPTLFSDPTGQYNEVVHGGFTYREALNAGMNERDAATYALADAGVDHALNSQPLRPANIATGRTTAYHFDPFAALEYYVAVSAGPGAMSLAGQGALAHSADDTGWTGNGPHAGSPLGHPLQFNEDWSLSWFGNAKTDSPYRNPERFRVEMRAKFVELCRTVYVNNGGDPRKWDPASITPQQWARHDQNVEKVLSLRGNDGYNYLAMPIPGTPGNPGVKQSYLAHRASASFADRPVEYELE